MNQSISVTFIITGTSRGLGYDLASSFCDRGDFVIGLSRSKANLKHDHYTHYQVDVRNSQEVEKFFFNLKERDKKFVLINSAGVAAMNHFLLTSPTKVADIFATNVVGTFNMSQHASRLMKSAGWGRIINISSVAVPLALEGEAAYVASKAAIEALTKVTAKELAPFNIAVNAIGPSLYNSDLIKNVPKQKLDKILDRLAIKKYCQTPDIINIIDFLTAPQSSTVTGQTLYLGGIG